MGSRQEPIREERVEDAAPVPRALEGVPSALISCKRTKERERRAREDRAPEQVWRTFASISRA